MISNEFEYNVSMYNKMRREGIKEKLKKSFNLKVRALLAECNFLTMANYLCFDMLRSQRVRSKGDRENASYLSEAVK